MRFRCANNGSIFCIGVQMSCCTTEDLFSCRQDSLLNKKLQDLLKVFNLLKNNNYEHFKNGKPLRDDLKKATDEY